MATGSKLMPSVEKKSSEDSRPDFWTRLEVAQTATIVYPLLEEVNSLLAQHSLNGLENPPILSLKKLLWDSPKLWENSVRGVVVKYNNDIVIRVIRGNKDYIEYTSIEYLKRKVPDIPAPRPHGLTVLGSFRVIFILYILDTTLV